MRTRYLLIAIACFFVFGLVAGGAFRRVEYDHTGLTQQDRDRVGAMLLEHFHREWRKRRGEE